jgi:hypothetical protein
LMDCAREASVTDAPYNRSDDAIFKFQ